MRAVGNSSSTANRSASHSVRRWAGRSTGRAGRPLMQRQVAKFVRRAEVLPRGGSVRAHDQQRQAGAARYQHGFQAGRQRQRDRPHEMTLARVAGHVNDWGPAPSAGHKPKPRGHLADPVAGDAVRVRTGIPYKNRTSASTAPYVKAEVTVGIATWATPVTVAWAGEPGRPRARHRWRPQRHR